MGGIDALRRAIAALADRPDDSADALRAAARLLADAARASDPVRAERLVIALKELWAVLPEVQRLAPSGPREAVWSRLVALVVEAFYAPHADAPNRTPNDAVRSLASSPHLSPLRSVS
jgi:hypothetical protein